MGRRALGKIRADIDLSRHFFEQEDLPQPLGDSFFAVPQPLEVEVGSGKGLFMRSAASDHPERNFLGIEIAGKYAKFAASHLAKRELTNAIMVRGDAMQLFRDNLQSQQLQAVHVYFPDPWWKKRHRKRRIMNDEFLRMAEDRLVPGGQLHFWTDVQDYFEEAIARVARVTQLYGPLAVDEESAEHDLDYRTHFERRMRLNGEAVYRSQFEKRA